MRSASAFAALSAVLISAAVLLGKFDIPSRGSRAPVRTVLQTTPLAVLEHAPSPAVAISSDGSHIAYVSGDTGRGQLYVRRFDQPEPVPIQAGRNVHTPFFSPDGTWVAFFAGGELRKVSVTGAGLTTLWRGCAGVHGAAWRRDNRIVVGCADGLMQISADGRIAEVIARPAALWPEAADDDAIVFTQGGWIWAQSVETGTRRRVVESSGNARYAAGHIVYPSKGSLVAVRFDPATLETHGEPVRVVDQVVTGLPEEPAIAHFAVSETGTLVYLAGDVVSSPGRTLHWVDRRGREAEAGLPPRLYARPRVSPDGTRIAVEYVENGNQEIGVYDLVRKTFVRLTSNAGIDEYPVWTADSRRISFRAARQGRTNLFWKSADGSGAEEPLTTDLNGDARPFAAAPDGKALLFSRETAGARYDVHQLTLSPPHASARLIPDASAPAISPDGRWVAYRAESDGRRFQVVVRPFPNVESGRWEVTTDGGGPPVWSQTGQEIFYTHNALGTMMSVGVETRRGFKHGKPQSVFTGRFTFSGDSRNFDVAPDGRFLMVRDVAPNLAATDRDELTVVRGWFADLDRQMRAAAR